LAIEPTAQTISDDTIFLLIKRQTEETLSLQDLYQPTQMLAVMGEKCAVMVVEILVQFCNSHFCPSANAINP
jgi:hypothetical protein